MAAREAGRCNDEVIHDKDFHVRECQGALEQGRRAKTRWCDVCRNAARAHRLPHVVRILGKTFDDLDLMRYTDTGSQSAEILRMVLPNISKHGGCYVPTAYTVWYEHLSGSNSRLTADLTDRLQKSSSLDQRAIEDMFIAHIQSRRAGNFSLLQKGLEALALRLAQAAADSSGGVDQFAQALETGLAELQLQGGSAELQTVLQKLIGSTWAARESVGTLRTELDASQMELRTMRDRLGALEAEVTRDPLTSLLNRRGFERAVEQLQTTGPGLSAAAVLMLDLDRFKRVNDTYGHLFGDQVLRAMAEVLNGVIKGSNIAARFGGEEFVVLLPRTSEADAVALAEQFRQSFAQVKVRRVGSDKIVEQLSVSIGVAVPLAAEPLERTIERADAALYRAKSEGRNCTRVAQLADCVTGTCPRTQ
jgi:diguanylate cyclase